MRYYLEALELVINKLSYRDSVWTEERGPLSHGGVKFPLLNRPLLNGIQYLGYLAPVLLIRRKPKPTPY